MCLWCYETVEKTKEIYHKFLLLYTINWLWDYKIKWMCMRFFFSLKKNLSRWFVWFERKELFIRLYLVYGLKNLNKYWETDIWILWDNMGGVHLTGIFVFKGLLVDYLFLGSLFGMLCRHYVKFWIHCWCIKL